MLLSSMSSLFYLTRYLLSSINFAAKGKISIFLWLKSIELCIYRLHFFHLYMYFVIWKQNREGEMERFPSYWFSFPKIQWLGLGQPAARNFNCVSHLGDRGSSAWPIFCCYPRILAIISEVQELGLEPALIWDAISEVVA